MKVPLTLGKGELHLQDLNALYRAVTSAEKASSDRGSTDECEEDEVMKIVSAIPS